MREEAISHIGTKAFAEGFIQNGEPYEQNDWGIEADNAWVNCHQSNRIVWQILYIDGE